MARATNTCADGAATIFCSRNGWQRSRSSGVGRLAGARSARPRSPRRRPARVRRRDESRWADWPARTGRARNNQSADRSPVNIRPVRLPPCAAGARPTSTMPARDRRTPAAAGPSSPSSRKAARRVMATSSRQATSRGQARHATISASSAQRPGGHRGRVCIGRHRLAGQDAADDQAEASAVHAGAARATRDHA